jgi:hypothetical protein
MRAGPREEVSRQARHNTTRERQVRSNVNSRLGTMEGQAEETEETRSDGTAGPAVVYSWLPL